MSPSEAIFLRIPEPLASELKKRAKKKKISLTVYVLGVLAESCGLEAPKPTRGRPAKKKGASE